MVIDFLFFLIATLIYVSPYNIGDGDNYILLTFLCLIYFLHKLRVEYKNNGNYFFLNPIFLTFIFTFCLGQGLISNLIIYYIDGEFKTIDYTSILKYEKWWLTKSMYINFISILSLWFGYKLSLGKISFNIYSKINIYRKIFLSNLNKNKIIILAISVYCFNIYLYKIGLFGRMVSEEYFTAGEGFKGLYFLSVFSNYSILFFSNS